MAGSFPNKPSPNGSAAIRNVTGTSTASSVGSASPVWQSSPQRSANGEGK